MYQPYWKEEVVDGVVDVVTVEQQERRGRNPNLSGGCRARVLVQSTSTAPVHSCYCSPYSRSGTSLKTLLHSGHGHVDSAAW